jgi:hypothetical protein
LKLPPIHEMPSLTIDERVAVFDALAHLVDFKDADDLWQRFRTLTPKKQQIIRDVGYCLGAP